MFYSIFFRKNKPVDGYANEFSKLDEQRATSLNVNSNNYNSKYSLCRW